MTDYENHVPVTFLFGEGGGRRCSESSNNLSRNSLHKEHLPKTFTETDMIDPMNATVSR